MSIDYEAEYNNRARVPDHPQIFARWEREAAAYRGEAEQAGRAELGLAYGPTPRQSIDLFYPAATKTGPLSLFIHGGYWRSLAPSQFSHVARGLNGHGITVAVAGYDLCPDVTIADIIAETRAACLFLWRRFGRKIMAYGHSAGGHLAACLLATDWRALAADAPRDLVPAAAAISGLFDLVPLVGVSMNADLRLTAAEARAASPLFWPAPSGLALETWCGALESGEFRRQNRIIAETWGKAGVDTVCLEVPDLNHFTVLDPLGQPESELTRRLAALAQRTGSNEARASAWRAQLFELIRRRSFGRGRIKLASGRESDFYFDLRPTALHPEGATCIGEMIVDALDGLAVDYIGGLEMGAVPIATAAAIAAHRRGRDINAFFVRKQPKEHGERKRIEGLPKGESLRGKNVVVVEDVTTTGGSAVKAAEAVEAEGGTVALVLTVVDRLEGAGETFAAARLPFRSLFTADEFLNA